MEYLKIINNGRKNSNKESAELKKIISYSLLKKPHQ